MRDETTIAAGPPQDTRFDPARKLRRVRALIEGCQAFTPGGPDPVCPHIAPEDADIAAAFALGARLAREKHEAEMRARYPDAGRRAIDRQHDHAEAQAAARDYAEAQAEARDAADERDDAA